MIPTPQNTIPSTFEEYVRMNAQSLMEDFITKKDKLFHEFCKEEFEEEFK